MDLIKQNRDCPVLYVVVPCYNEEEVLPETAKRMRAKLRGLIAEKKISPHSRIMFVNDGSRDRTWEMIETLAHADPLFAGVKLSRNRGHQNAVLAGLMTARGKCDCAISIDADLQDDINAIDGMVADFCAGSELYMASVLPVTPILFSSGLLLKGTTMLCSGWALNWSSTMLTTG